MLTYCCKDPKSLQISIHLQDTVAMHKFINHQNLMLKTSTMHTFFRDGTFSTHKNIETNGVHTASNGCTQLKKKKNQNIIQIHVKTNQYGYVLIIDVGSACYCSWFIMMHFVFVFFSVLHFEVYIKEMSSYGRYY